MLTVHRHTVGIQYILDELLQNLSQKKKTKCKHCVFFLKILREMHKGGPSEPGRMPERTEVASWRTSTVGVDGNRAEVHPRQNEHDGGNGHAEVSLKGSE